MAIKSIHILNVMVFLLLYKKFKFLTSSYVKYHRKYGPNSDSLNMIM